MIHLPTPFSRTTLSLFLSGAAWITASFLTGCGTKDDTASQGLEPQISRKDIQKYPPPVLEPVSVEDARQVVSRFNEALSAGEFERAGRQIDYDIVLRRACYGVDPNDSFRRGFEDGARKSMSTYPQQVAQALGGARLWDIVRVRKQEHGVWVLVRHYGSGTEFAYYDFLVARGAKGRAAIVDVFPLSNGEPMSRSLRRFFLVGAADQSRSLLEKLSKEDNLLIQSMPAIQEMMQAGREGNAERAVAIYESLPLEVRRIKFIAAQVILAGATLQDTDRYSRLVENYMEWYPNDPTLRILLIDYYAKREEREALRKVINELDQAVGGDPFLDLQRAQVDIAEENWSQARKRAQRVIESVPKSEHAYWTAFVAAVELKDHADAVQQLQHLHREFDANPRGLETVEDYQEFIRSPEYREWIKTVPELR